MGKFSTLVLWQWLSDACRNYGKSGYERLVKSKDYVATDIPEDLSNCVFIVTGANSGIGKATTEALASRGGIVHMLCRNKDRANAALDEIKNKHPKATNLHIHIVDMSSSASVKEFASSFTESKVDALINNAGGVTKTREESVDKIEMCMGTMLGGTYLLTKLLINKLKNGKVINVVSGGMYPAKLNINDLQQNNNFDPMFAYAHMKRAQVILTEKWSSIEKNIQFFSVHPGWVDTEGVRVDTMKWFYEARWRPELRSCEEGADTIVWLAAGKHVDKINNAPPGSLWFDRNIQIKYYRLGWTKSSKEDVDQLWEECKNIFKNTIE
eukprot:GHVL01005697.1.p1 GENE.GHVL01005697.1~~GHVL01005697.1.p1  ORF type:complete len:325 (-),score=80.98 GHVL01005697.1:32-1006(-)